MFNTVYSRLLQGPCPPLFSSEGRRDGTVRDLALVMCHHGQDPIRIGAERSALKHTLHATPRPALVVFVEAMFPGEEMHFGKDITALGQYGKYIHKELPEGSRDMWLKEALWNIGAKEAMKDKRIRKLCFLDADSAFSEAGWADYVSKALDKFEVISPHSHLYYSDQPDGKGLKESMGYAACTGKGGGLPGIALGMTTGFYADRLPGGEIFNMPSGYGDAWFWSEVLGGKVIHRTILDHLDHCAQIPDRRYGMCPKAQVGTAGLLAVHFYHGPLGDRGWTEKRVISRACASVPEELVELTGEGLPVWPGTPGARIASRIMNTTARKGFRGSRDLYDEEAIKEYGPIDPDHPFAVVCLLRSGESFGPGHVYWLKEQFDRHCKVPFRFVCQTDLPGIEGIETVPLLLPLNKVMRAGAQVEHYRDIWGPGTSVLTCDLDTVVRRDFTPHRCPEGRLFMLREFGAWYRESWNTWGAGLTYFRGDFSFIPEMYSRDLAIGGARDPRYQYRSSQEYIWAALREKGMFPGDIMAHFCPQYWNGSEKGIRDDGHFVVFPMDPKPWDIKPRPGWIPELVQKK